MHAPWSFVSRLASQWNSWMIMMMMIDDPAIIIGTVRSLWTWLWGRYHVPQNVFLVSLNVSMSIYIYIGITDNRYTTRGTVSRGFKMGKLGDAALYLNTHCYFPHYKVSRQTLSLGCHIHIVLGLVGWGLPLLLRLVLAGLALWLVSWIALIKYRCEYGTLRSMFASFALLVGLE